jgi:hypothetical protein
VSQTGIRVNGVSTFSGGITNSGTILGTVFGLSINGVSTFIGGVSNSGTISSAGTAISIQNTPSVSIFDSGTINAGSSNGATPIAIQFASGINTLTLGPGFAINGNVLGNPLGGATNILQLGGSGTDQFNLNNIGTQYTGFNTFSVISATWATTGTNATGACCYRHRWTDATPLSRSVGSDHWPQF